MKTGTGIKDFLADIASSSPATGQGIRVGDDLYAELKSIGKITNCVYLLNGSTLFPYEFPTFDEKYPIGIDTSIGVSDYKYID